MALLQQQHLPDQKFCSSCFGGHNGINSGTAYHFRIVATNSDGTSYGSDLTFTPGGAIVSTTAASAVTLNSATSGGNVTSDGGSAITAKGVCWSTSANPTISGSHTTDGSGLGSYTSSITGLSSTTTYHIRAYATNTYGTFYGEDLTFTTLCGTITSFPGVKDLKTEVQSPHAGHRSRSVARD
jgi:hypothetical protein